MSGVKGAGFIFVDRLLIFFLPIDVSCIVNFKIINLFSLFFLTLYIRIYIYILFHRAFIVVCSTLSVVFISFTYCIPRMSFFFVLISLPVFCVFAALLCLPPPPCAVLISPAAPLSPQTPYDNKSLTSPILRGPSSAGSLNHSPMTPSPRSTVNQSHMSSSNSSSYVRQQQQRKSPYPGVSPPAYNTVSNSSTIAQNYDSMPRQGYSTVSSATSSYGRQASTTPRQPLPIVNRSVNGMHAVYL